MLVRQRFQNADVTVVAGIGIRVIARGADALERVDDDEPGLRMLLLLQQVYLFLKKNLLFLSTLLFYKELMIKLIMILLEWIYHVFAVLIVQVL